MKNNLILCEIFHPSKYGLDENSDKNLETQIIVLYSYKYNIKILKYNSFFYLF